jgi:hypothetical protein
MRIVVCASSDDGKNNVVGERPGKFTTANIGEKFWVPLIRMYCTTRVSPATLHVPDEQVTALSSTQVQ